MCGDAITIWFFVSSFSFIVCTATFIYLLHWVTHRAKTCPLHFSVTFLPKVNRHPSSSSNKSFSDVFLDLFDPYGSIWMSKKWINIVYITCSWGVFIMNAHDFYSLQGQKGFTKRESSWETFSDIHKVCRVDCSMEIWCFNNSCHIFILNEKKKKRSQTKRGGVLLEGIKSYPETVYTQMVSSFSNFRFISNGPFSISQI